MSTSFSSVPVVDFSRLKDVATKQAELRILQDALFNIGFLYLINTGVEVRFLFQILA